MKDNEPYSDYLTGLNDLRREAKARSKSLARKALTKNQRLEIFGKTGGRCHICGGIIRETNWDADHVLSHSKGGSHAVENYLPAHKLCNNYRWDYLPEEFQEILKLGVWVRTQVARKSAVGKLIEDKFGQYESRKRRRRKNSGDLPGS